jgi:arginyl-tRNA synthetase
MDLFKKFYEKSAGASIAVVQRLAPSVTLDLGKLAVQVPRHREHGEMANNAPFVAAPQAGMTPAAFADEFIKEFAGDPDFAVSFAKPGFINAKLSDAALQRVVADVLRDGADYGRSDMGQKQRVNVEYVSANPTGPLHVGHCRGAVFGDALANLLAKMGFTVAREYYINDAGAQVDVLARSAYLRYREAAGESIGEIPAGLYPGDYLKPVGQALLDRHGRSLLDMPEAEWLPVVRAAAVAMMLDLIKDDLAMLGIHHEVFVSEGRLHREGGVKIAIDDLARQGLVYEGRLPPPKGQPPEDWEDREQLLFRASDFGDDIDRPLVKSDGSYTYFASDVAYARDKIARGFDQLIYVLGADHGGYVKRLQALVGALSQKRVVCDVKLTQLVKLFRGGEPVRMSKRAGEFVTLRDVVGEVGPDVVRFIMLYRKNDAPLDFDFEKVTEQSRDNPVFYVQYAHARICSVFRNAELELGESITSDSLASADLSLLIEEPVLEVIRRLSEYPRVLEQAAAAHEPHRVAFYLFELASDFHALWNAGLKSPQLRFISKRDRPVTFARLAFLSAIRYALASGLKVLGVRPVDVM